MQILNLSKDIEAKDKEIEKLKSFINITTDMYSKSNLQHDAQSIKFQEEYQTLLREIKQKESELEKQPLRIQVFENGDKLAIKGFRKGREKLFELAISKDWKMEVNGDSLDEGVSVPFDGLFKRGKYMGEYEEDGE
jgi:hypothetical protein